MDLREAIGLIKYGKCILFTGAGFSLGARNLCPKENGEHCEFLTPNKLAEKLAAEFDFDEPNEGLGAVAQFYLDTHSKGQLIDFLKREFTATSISEDQRLIGGLPWRRCYTTNYDEIFEDAAQAAGSPRKVVTLGTPVREVTDSLKACIHINGAISRLTPATLDAEFKLTTRSYNADDLHYSPWFERFKDDLMNADAVFFIGFSGKYDLDITRVFQQTSELKEKTFFIISPRDSKSAVRKLSDFGKVEPIELHGFAEEVRKHPDALSKPDKRPKLNGLRCFHEITDTEAPASDGSASELARLLSRGVVNDRLLSYSVRVPERYKYVVYRERVGHVLSKIKSGIRTFIITSNLGNGKTIFLKELAVKLRRGGYRPYFFFKERDFILDEVEYICGQDKTPVLIFDGYADKIKLIKKVISRLSEETILIISERTARYETTYDLVDEFDDCPYEISVDCLDDIEIKTLVQLMDTYGLWDEMAGESIERKCQYISRKCHSRLSDFLLTRMNAIQLKNSYAEVLNSISDKQEFYQALLYILWCKYLGVDIELDAMMESMTGNVMNNPTFMHNAAVKEMIDFSQGKITLTSSILAYHILSQQIPPKEFVDFYIKLFDNLDKQSDSRNVRKVLKEMMQHRNISKILKENELIISIYDSISDRRFCIDNPQFWLQNAIARMPGEDYETAAHHFKTAYALAANIKGYSTYQIDTHHARFLLLKAVKKGLDTSERPFELFMEAHRKLKTRRKGDEYRTFIYRAAAEYLPFWKKYQSLLSDMEKVHFKQSCQEILVMAYNFMDLENATETNKGIVQKTVNALNEIVG